MIFFYKKVKKYHIKNSKEICSDCGTQEAFSGDFWHGNALYGEIRKGAE